MNSEPISTDCAALRMEWLARMRLLSEQGTSRRTSTRKTVTRLDPRSLFGDPVSPKQALFLSLTCEEALYGGAAGGGKSSGLLMAALQYVHQPRYSALLMRRTYTDLSMPGALMDRAHLWLDGSVARWNQNEKKWIFPSGATLKFGFCEHERDVQQYKSAEFHFIGIDEASEFSEDQYTYMFSRLRRRPDSPVPIRLRAASNPGPLWLKQRFSIPPGFREGVHWADEGVRAFVPARMWDNPGIDSDEYSHTLRHLSPVLRLQLAEGDWEVRPEGKLFRREWFPIREAGPVGGRAVRAWDLAATGQGGDYTAGLKMRVHERHFWIEDLAHGQWSPHDRDRVILQTAALDGPGTEIVFEQEPGAAGKAQIDSLVRALAGYRVSGRRVTGDKLTRAGPLASQAEAGNVLLLAGAWNGTLIDELVSMPTTGVHDDIVDATSLAFSILAPPPLNPLAGIISVGRAKGWQPAAARSKRHF